MLGQTLRRGRDRKDTHMPDTPDIRKSTAAVRSQIEDFVLKAQEDLLRALRGLSQNIAKETTRMAPSTQTDLTRLVDEIFDFTERVLAGQRKMVNDVIRSVEGSRVAKELARPTQKAAAKK